MHFLFMCALIPLINAGSEISTAHEHCTSNCDAEIWPQANRKKTE